MKIEHILRIIESDINSRMRTVEAWKKEFESDAFYAFRWSDDAMKASAELNVLRAVVIVLQQGMVDGKDEAILFSSTKSKLERAVMSKAKSPKQSTSASQNICEQYELAAMAWILEKFFEEGE